MRINILNKMRPMFLLKTLKYCSILVILFIVLYVLYGKNTRIGVSENSYISSLRDLALDDKIEDRIADWFKLQKLELKFSDKSDERIRASKLFDGKLDCRFDWGMLGFQSSSSEVGFLLDRNNNICALSFYEQLPFKRIALIYIIDEENFKKIWAVEFMKFQHGKLGVIKL